MPSFAIGNLPLRELPSYVSWLVRAIQSVQIINCIKRNTNGISRFAKWSYTLVKVTAKALVKPYIAVVVNEMRCPPKSQQTAQANSRTTNAGTQT